MVNSNWACCQPLLSNHLQHLWDLCSKKNHSTWEPVQTDWRIIKAGVIPLDMLQRYINKWVSTAHDLFGVDASSSAHWAYVWGIKGRWDERKKLDDWYRGKQKVLNEESKEVTTIRRLSLRSRNCAAIYQRAQQTCMCLP